MKKVIITLMCLAAMLVAGTGLKAQEVTITLVHGWNWISYPNAEAMQVGNALGDFIPADGDMIQSQFANSKYTNGRWRGGVTQFMPGWGYMYYSSRTEDVEFVFAQSSNASVATATPTDITAVSAVVGGMVMLPEGCHVFLRGVCWGTAPNPDIDGDHTSVDTGIGSFTIDITDLTPSSTYYVRAYAVTDQGLAYGNEESFTTENEGGSDGHAYVDLGLPSGTLWATCNVGANAPEEYGDYFAWGETQPKDFYDWSTYQYCNGTYYDTIYLDEDDPYYDPDYHPFDLEPRPFLTKYCNKSSCGYNGFTDSLTTLLPEDDAATANWGSDWRMPTFNEWEELYQNTTIIWTTQNGVDGGLFTASNGNSLFLPASVLREEEDVCSGETIQYFVCNYWSSSLSIWPRPGDAWSFFFGLVNYEEGWYYNGMDWNGRCSGLSVRPVRSPAQNNAPTGAINGKFSINASGDEVYFSQGNLQYIGSAATPYWKFADNQWDVLGTTTGQASSDQNIDRDFFGWGASGYNHGAVCYQPWSTSLTNSDYYAYGQDTYNLYEQTGQADWGYNPISNGGNQANSGWRTLTTDEWNYLFNTRSTPSGIRYAKACVNNVNGMILLSDDWSTSYYTLNNTNSGSASYSSNTITAEQWNVLELHGAVFLPAAGVRYGTSVYSVDSYGYYWSDSYYNSDYAYDVYFRDGRLNPQDYSYRLHGFSVRLVHSAQNAPSYTISVSANPSEGGSVSGDGTYIEGADCTLRATTNAGYTFTNWTENGVEVSTDTVYSFTVNGNRNLVANFAVSGGGDTHTYVDLGLPSGLLWATCNVGADNPEDYGDYFAWGETQPKDTYSWSTYQYCMGSSSTLTKYCNDSSYGYNGFTDNLTTLLPEDDAATANWGAGWRMPTYDEWVELYNNTTCTWTTQNGVNGRLFTASNGVTLFLPAAGYRDYSSLDYAGSLGDYWSSSLSTGYPYNAWLLSFGSDDYCMSRYNRHNGQSVRAVRSASQN